MFYGWLRSGRTSRQQAENTLSSSGVSLNAFRESNAVTEKKVRTLMFSRVLEKDGNSFLILLSAASGNIKMPDLFIAVSSAVFRIFLHHLVFITRLLPEQLQAASRCRSRAKIKVASGQETIMTEFTSA
jgi:hypothetical protein